MNLEQNGFKQVKFSYGEIHFQGGYATKPVPMTSKTLLGGNTFVKMSCNDVWLLRATTGQSKRYASLFGRTLLLEYL